MNITEMTKDEELMNHALDQALKAKTKGEIPVGAIIVKDKKIIARGYNQSISKNDPTAHAEIQAIRVAGNFLNNYRLVGTSIFVTLEPCAMCLGAIMHARIEKIIYGARDYKTGVCGSCENLLDSKFFNHSVSISGGILENQCGDLLKKFFNELR